ncbi:MAG TPA: hypothetical protein VGQ35_09590 [Dongiaceae bacterium]|nr:hypothetical protein [Dongiaceae bacterium]
MFGLERLLAGVVLSVMAVIGLFISANAHDGGFAFFGYLLFLFAVLMLFRYVAVVTGKEESKP